MQTKIRKIISFLICFLLIFEQSGFAQVAPVLDLSSAFSGLRNSLVQDKFRPVHLRYLNYDNVANNFKLLLDKGDAKNINKTNLEASTKTLLKYFFIGLSIPNEKFWVNLRPDGEENVIDPVLARTDAGKILLEADLQLKKDTALATSPQTPEGKAYWSKLYQRAGELFGSDNVTIPTLTRPWIVPGEIIIRESDTNAYVYKATLKVMLEQDYLKDSATYNFKDPRQKALNEYSSQLIRETIIPKLTREINTSKRYAPLRQLFYSLILAQWFKSRFYGKGGLYSWVIDKENLNDLTSEESWSKNTYFKQYQNSFKNGEYNIQEPTNTPSGQVVRSYFSGGINALVEMPLPTSASSPVSKLGLVTAIRAGNGMPAGSGIARASVNISSLIVSAPFSGLEITAGNFAASPKVSSEPNKDDIALAAKRAIDRNLKHGNVNQFIKDNLPEDLRGFENLSPREKKEVLDKYRDSQGRIVIPIRMLLRGLGILGHVGLGRAFGEPVIFIDEKLNASEQQRVKEHEEFEIAGWEKKRQALGLKPEEMRNWIQAPENIVEARSLAVQLHKGAPSIDGIFRKWAEGLNDDQDLHARRRWFQFQQGRVERIARRIIDAARDSYPEFWRIVRNVTGLELKDAQIEDVVFTAREQSEYLAGVLNTQGEVLLDLAGSLEDDELAWVLAHEITHAQEHLQRNNPKGGETNQTDAQASKQADGEFKNDEARAALEIFARNPFGRTVSFEFRIDFDPDFRAQIEAASHRMEFASDAAATFLLARAGFDPRAAAASFRKVAEFKSGNLLPSKKPLFSTHPTDEARIERLEEQARASEMEADANVYEENDIILAAAPGRSGTASSPSVNNEQLIDLVEKSNILSVKNDRWEKGQINFSNPAELINELNKRSRGALVFEEFIQKYALEAQGGYGLGVREPYSIYYTLCRIFGLVNFTTAYAESGIGLTTPRHTETFLKQITDSELPVVFFIPNGIQNSGNTREEIKWMLNNLGVLKNVFFVFGAYDYFSNEELRSGDPGNNNIDLMVGSLKHRTNNSDSQIKRDFINMIVENIRRHDFRRQKAMRNTSFRDGSSPVNNNLESFVEDAKVAAVNKDFVLARELLAKAKGAAASEVERSRLEKLGQALTAGEDVVNRGGFVSPVFFYEGLPHEIMRVLSEDAFSGDLTACFLVEKKGYTLDEFRDLAGQILAHLASREAGFRREEEMLEKPDYLTAQGFFDEVSKSEDVDPKVADLAETYLELVRNVSSTEAVYRDAKREKLIAPFRRVVESGKKVIREALDRGDTQDILDSLQIKAEDRISVYGESLPFSMPVVLDSLDELFNEYSRAQDDRKAMQVIDLIIVAAQIDYVEAFYILDDAARDLGVSFEDLINGRLREQKYRLSVNEEWVFPEFAGNVKALNRVYEVSKGKKDGSSPAALKKSGGSSPVEQSRRDFLRGMLQGAVAVTTNPVKLSQKEPNDYNSIEDYRIPHRINVNQKDIDFVSAVTERMQKNYVEAMAPTYAVLRDFGVDLPLFLAIAYCESRTEMKNGYQKMISSGEIVSDWAENENSSAKGGLQIMPAEARRIAARVESIKKLIAEQKGWLGSKDSATYEILAGMGFLNDGLDPEKISGSLLDEYTWRAGATSLLLNMDYFYDLMLIKNKSDKKYHFKPRKNAGQDWGYPVLLTVVAAHNTGAPNAQNALREGGGTAWYKVKKLLQNETENYVDTFLIARRVFREHPELVEGVRQKFDTYLQSDKGKAHMALLWGEVIPPDTGVAETRIKEVVSQLKTVLREEDAIELQPLSFPETTAEQQAVETEKKESSNWLGNVALTGGVALGVLGAGFALRWIIARRDTMRTQGIRIESTKEGMQAALLNDFYTVLDRVVLANTSVVLDATSRKALIEEAKFRLGNDKEVTDLTMEEIGEEIATWEREDILEIIGNNRKPRIVRAASSPVNALDAKGYFNKARRDKIKRVVLVVRSPRLSHPLELLWPLAQSLEQNFPNSKIEIYSPLLQGLKFNTSRVAVHSSLPADFSSDALHNSETLLITDEFASPIANAQAVDTVLLIGYNMGLYVQAERIPFDMSNEETRYKSRAETLQMLGFEGIKISEPPVLGMSDVSDKVKNEMRLLRDKYTFFSTGERVLFVNILSGDGRSWRTPREVWMEVLGKLIKEFDGHIILNEWAGAELFTIVKSSQVGPFKQSIKEVYDELVQLYGQEVVDRKLTVIDCTGIPRLMAVLMLSQAQITEQAATLHLGDWMRLPTLAFMFPAFKEYGMKRSHLMDLNNMGVDVLRSKDINTLITDVIVKNGNGDGHVGSSPAEDKKDGEERILDFAAAMEKRGARSTGEVKVGSKVEPKERTVRQLPEEIKKEIDSRLLTIRKKAFPIRPLQLTMLLIPVWSAMQLTEGTKEGVAVSIQIEDLDPPFEKIFHDGFNYWVKNSLTDEHGAKSEALKRQVENAKESLMDLSRFMIADGDRIRSHSEIADIIDYIGEPYPIDPGPAKKTGTDISSSPVLNDKGGVDFRALPIVTQGMPSVLGRVPSGARELFKAGGAKINNDKEWQEIQNMLNAGIIPSSQRIKDYIGACCAKGAFDQDIDKILGCIADIFRMEEERVAETDPALTGLLVLLETKDKTDELAIGLSGIKVLAREPKRLEK